MSDDAEIVFMPYNYLVDTASRRQLASLWPNAVVIFDEAHNLHDKVPVTRQLRGISLEFQPGHHLFPLIKHTLDKGQFFLCTPISWPQVFPRFELGGKSVDLAVFSFGLGLRD